MLRIYGASDDLIELDGDVSDEYGWCSDDDGYLVLSDGTIIAAGYYSNGHNGWNIRVIQAGTLPAVGQTLTDSEGANNLEVQVSDGVEWALFVEGDKDRAMRIAAGTPPSRAAVDRALGHLADQLVHLEEDTQEAVKTLQDYFRATRGQDAATKAEDG